MTEREKDKYLHRWHTEQVLLARYYLLYLICPRGRKIGVSKETFHGESGKGMGNGK